MTTKIFLEGGGDAKDLQARCREGFRSDYWRSAGSRDANAAIGRLWRSREPFTITSRLAHANNTAGGYIAMWIDSEDPIDDVEAAWQHLRNAGDGWAKARRCERRAGSSDDHLHGNLDRLRPRDPEGSTSASKLQDSALPPLVEHGGTRSRDAIQNALIRASRNCYNAYAKGKRSFELSGQARSGSPQSSPSQLPQSKTHPLRATLAIPSRPRRTPHVLFQPTDLHAFLPASHRGTCDGATCTWRRGRLMRNLIEGCSARPSPARARKGRPTIARSWISPAADWP